MSKPTALSAPTLAGLPRWLAVAVTVSAIAFVSFKLFHRSVVDVQTRHLGSVDQLQVQQGTFFDATKTTVMLQSGDGLTVSGIMNTSGDVYLTSLVDRRSQTSHYLCNTEQVSAVQVRNHCSKLLGQLN